MKVLFICKGNMFRSQVAMSIYNKLTGTKDANSAGTYTGSSDEPEGQPLEGCFRTQDFFELMEENGMNVRNNTTKKLLPEMVDVADVVVSMAEEPYIPDFLRNNKKVIWWNVENPKFVDKKIARHIYNKINRLVHELIYNKKDKL